MVDKGKRQKKQQPQLRDDGSGILLRHRVFLLKLVPYLYFSKDHKTDERDAFNNF